MDWLKTSLTVHTVCFNWKVCFGSFCIIFRTTLLAWFLTFEIHIKSAVWGFELDEVDSNRKWFCKTFTIWIGHPNEDECMVHILFSPLHWPGSEDIIDSAGIDHRGLKLDGAIGQGEICNSLKSEKFSKSFLSHIGKKKNF